jgi:hypothetical protein
VATKQDLTDLRLATAALADDLVAVWRACEQIDGPNLSEQLSWALGTAAKRLLVETGGPIDQTEAEEILVRHRPGCWEATHVRSLTLMVDLIDEG